MQVSAKIRWLCSTASIDMSSERHNSRGKLREVLKIARGESSGKCFNCFAAGGPVAIKRLIAVFVLENEYYAALRAMEVRENVSRDSFVMGEVDECSCVRIDRKPVAKETHQVSQRQCHLSILLRFRTVQAPLRKIYGEPYHN
jgi:hypothetical protein